MMDDSNQIVSNEHVRENINETLDGASTSNDNTNNSCDQSINMLSPVIEGVETSHLDKQTSPSKNSADNETMGIDKEFISNFESAIFGYENNNSTLPELDSTSLENRCLNNEDLIHCAPVNVNPSPNNFEMVSNGLLSNRGPLDLSCNKSVEDSVVIPNSNAVSSPSMVSLAQLQSYGSAESLPELPDKDMTSYRDTKSPVIDVSDDSDDSSSESPSSIYITSSTDSEGECEARERVMLKPIKSKGELELNDLPPIEDLQISVPEEDCKQIGTVYKIIDQLVVVESVKNTPTLNLESVLFLEGGKPLGKIFDVMGQVTKPFYCVRFNSSNEIKEKNIELKQKIYCAPKTDYTSYVFVSQLLKLKGSDASWKNDNEPPEMFLDYSDDEQERLAKNKLKNKKNEKVKQRPDADEPAMKKHHSYEQRMNQLNLQITAARKKMDSRVNRLKRMSTANSGERFGNVPQPAFGRSPVFNQGVGMGGYFPPNPGMVDSWHTMTPNTHPSMPSNFEIPTQYFHDLAYTQRPYQTSQVPHSPRFIENNVPAHSPHLLEPRVPAGGPLYCCTPPSRVPSYSNMNQFSDYSRPSLNAHIPHSSSWGAPWGAEWSPTHQLPFAFNPGDLPPGTN